MIGAVMIRVRSLLKPLSFFAVLLLAGCGADPDPEPVVDAIEPMATATPAPDPAPQLGIGLAEGFAPIAFDLARTSWLVVAVDGEPLADRYADLATVHFSDSMLYWQGCNHHEGLYVATRASFATGQTTATAVNCPPESPDGTMARVLGGRPLIGGNAEEKVMLAVEGHSLTLSQIDSRYKPLAAPPLEAGPFRLLVPDGGARPPVLSFTGNRFAVWMDCAEAITGTASVRDGRMRTADVATGSCQTHRPTATASLKDFFASNPRIARGPNGELMLTDGETVIAGRQCYPDASPCAYALAGSDVSG